MKTVAGALAIAQAKVFVKPSTSLTCRDFGWPQKAGGSSAAVTSGVQPRMFNWESAYSDATTPNWHGACFAGDGSLNRFLVSGSSILHQRVASPTLTSTFTSWTNIANGETTAGHPVACAALGATVMVFWLFQNAADGNKYHTRHKISSDYGATWGSTVTSASALPLNCEDVFCLAACIKSDGTRVIAYAIEQGASVTYPDDYYVGILKWNGSAWVESKYSTTLTAHGVAIFHDGNDYNMVFQVLSGGSYYLQSLIYGDGGYVTASTWSAPQTLSLSTASVEYETYFKQYVDTYSSMSTMDLAHQLITTSLYGSGAAQVTATTFLEQYPYTPSAGSEWINQAAMILAQAEANLGLTYPFIHQSANCPPILSAYKSGKQYFYRLKSGTDFYEDEWQKSDFEVLTCTYGAALASYGNYIWMSRPNGLHRSLIPMRGWVTPTAGSGAHASSETIPQTAIIDYEERIGVSGGSFRSVADNSAGTYDSATTHIAKGSRVECNLGISAAYPTERNHYFIDDIQYLSDSGVSRAKFECVDAWTLLERYKLPADQEYNFETDEITVMGIIEKAITCIGGTLTDDAATTLATTLYPKVEFAAGESGKSVVTKMLALVEDVIKFRGLEGIIVNPQTTDWIVARYQHPSS